MSMGRNTTRMPLRAVLISAACLLSVFTALGAPAPARGASAPTQPLYVVTDLGTGTGAESWASAINAAGDIVGTTGGWAKPLAFLYTGGVLRELLDLHLPYPSYLPYEISAAYGINDRGQVLVQGWSGYAIYNDGTTVLLPGNLTAHAINNDGEVVGSLSGYGGDASHVALYRDGAVADLGLAGYGAAINGLGDIVGSLWRTGTQGIVSHAFLRSRDGAVLDLGSLVGPAGWSFAEGVNDAGVVVGQSEAAGARNAFRVAPGGVMEDLGNFGGDNGNYSEAFAINEAGEIVGQATCDSGDRPLHATLWKDGEMWDLNDVIAPDSGWSLEAAHDVNDAGSIVGWGWTGGHRHAVLLTPTVVDSIYEFSGFAPPIDSIPTVNAVQAGATIPVRFGLGGDRGTDIFAPGYPLSQPTCVAASAPVDPVETTATGSSGLTYSAATGLYTYAWKTDPAWAGTQRQLVLGLADGTYYRATFAFR